MSQLHCEMKVRHGRFGAFLGCTQYPECKGIVNIPKKGEVVLAPEDLPECPAIGCPRPHCGPQIALWENFLFLLHLPRVRCDCK